MEQYSLFFCILLRQSQILSIFFSKILFLVAKKIYLQIFIIISSFFSHLFVCVWMSVRGWKMNYLGKKNLNSFQIFFLLNTEKTYNLWFIFTLSSSNFEIQNFFHLHTDFYYCLFIQQLKSNKKRWRGIYIKKNKQKWKLNL